MYNLKAANLLCHLARNLKANLSKEELLALEVGVSVLLNNPQACTEPLPSIVPEGMTLLETLDKVQLEG